jgi:hypothetical protein
MLHHDNTPHTSLLICEFLAKHKTTSIPQLPCSPDLPLVEVFLFPKLKSTFKGHRFQMIEEIEEILLQDLHAILQMRSRTGRNFGNGIASLSINVF